MGMQLKKLATLPTARSVGDLKEQIKITLDNDDDSMHTC